MFFSMGTLLTFWFWENGSKIPFTNAYWLLTENRVLCDSRLNYIMFKISKCPSSIFLPFELPVPFCRAMWASKINIALSKYLKKTKMPWFKSRVWIVLFLIRFTSISFFLNSSKYFFANVQLSCFGFLENVSKIIFAKVC